ncbi:MAG: AraC family transcriptional regulator [Gorillibacterium sp.]|nr:AraC family transcriptional regulator [Gorillibacterium sp.]
MISISGNALNNWFEVGFESKDSFLTVNNCGYQKLMTRNLTRKRDKGRVDYQLIYMVSGKGLFRFDNKTIEVSGGQIVMYTPNQPQNYSYYAKDSTEAYWIHFTGYAAHDYLQEFGLLNDSIHSVGGMDEVIILYKKIIRELNMNKPLRGHITTAYLFTILTLLGIRLQDTEGQRKADPHADINKIIEIMHEKYNQNLVVTNLAQECGLSLFRFIHKFKVVTGTTPVKYITGIRINEAKKLLSESSLNVREVASIVGYENPFYFSRVFHSTVGIPPSQYKKQFLN